jgi:hypothetical protein
MSTPVFGVLDDPAGRVGPAFWLTRRYVRAADARCVVKREPVKPFVSDEALTGFAIADGAVEPAHPGAIACDHVKRCQPGVFDGFRGFDEFLGPCDGFVLLNQTSHKCVYGDGRRSVEVAMVGGPSKRGAQVGQFGGEPHIGLALPRAVPEGEHIGLHVGEVPRVRIACQLRPSGRHELVFRELPDGLQHRKPGSPR